ncbi:MAG: DUF3570 domain-containing protein [Kofleriaceae bacterium]|nr:DUF3570 domain-containing protein [Kofleriaceae bacterium]
MIRSALLALPLIAASLSTASADGNVTIRGAYYKEHSTKVVQPMIDAELEAGEHGTFAGHLLVDSITSASAASGAAGTAFNESRNELGADYTHDFGDIRLGLGGRYSTEPDYQSRFVNLSLESDFAQRNTTIGVNLARGFDTLDNSGAQGGLSSILTGELDTTMISLSASQILSPESIMSVSYDLSYLDGFQQNIYRTVVAGGMISAERLPDSRLRHALASTIRYHLTPTNTTFIGAYRFYIDDWGILGHSPESRIIQELFDGDVDIHLSYRHYRQSAADFYEDIYDSGDVFEEPFLSGDDKLGDVRNHTFGFKTGIYLGLFGLEGKWADVRVDGLVQYLKQNTHYGDAIISQVALTFPVEY